MIAKKQIAKHVDYFCGAGGWSQGFKQAGGFKTIIAIDNDKYALETHKLNHPEASHICVDIKDFPPREMHKQFPSLIINDTHMVFTCSPPCQFWSYASQKKSRVAKDTKRLVDYFAEHVAYFCPAFVCIENVPGWRKRERESGLWELKGVLSECGYKYSEGFLSALNYGVPQSRLRYILMASALDMNKVRRLMEVRADIEEGCLPGVQWNVARKDKRTAALLGGCVKHQREQDMSYEDLRAHSRSEGWA